MTIYPPPPADGNVHGPPSQPCSLCADGMEPGETCCACRYTQPEAFSDIGRVQRLTLAFAVTIAVVAKVAKPTATIWRWAWRGGRPPWEPSTLDLLRRAVRRG